mmetsp:Transcript_27542/g.58184  ORF Transcript_27542/g.58184 Transcript_27542/m.58184 type:complete len:201 (-) Transcript_27542:183-785(-)
MIFKNRTPRQRCLILQVTHTHTHAFAPFVIYFFLLSQKKITRGKKRTNPLFHENVAELSPFTPFTSSTSFLLLPPNNPFIPPTTFRFPNLAKRYNHSNGKTTMSVANLTHMTMVNLNNSVGRRINEKPPPPLPFDSLLVEVDVVDAAAAAAGVVMSTVAASPLVPKGAALASPVDLFSVASSDLLLLSSLVIRVVTMDDG